MIEDMYRVLDRINEIRGRFGLNKPSEAAVAPVNGATFADHLTSSRAALEGAADPTQKNFRTHMSVEEIDSLAEKISREQGVSPALVKSIIKTESDYDADAVSPKGAMGLMQLMPSAVEDMGVSDPFSPEQNISGGVKMLKKLIGTYQGDYQRAIAAYNAGKAAVDKSGGIPAIQETRDYVRKVADTRKMIEEIQGNEGE